MINLCECGDVIDESWKTLCKKCYLKKYKPGIYKKQYEIGEIVCKKCGNIFVDELWKDLCFRCWVVGKEEAKILDLEEREQFGR